MNYIDYDEKGQARSFVGPQAVDVFAMAAIATGLRMWAECGIRPNRNWTPKNMMAAAEQYLGKKFKARAYLEAARELTAKVNSEKARLAKENLI